MKFESDIVFEGNYLFCPELDEGFQIFNSWADFINLYTVHMHKENKPLYVYEATVNGNNIFVNAGQLVQIPWNEIEQYI